MLTTIIRAAVLAGALLSASDAFAQKPIVSLAPMDPPRWDVAAHVGWFAANKSEIAPDWNDWYDAAAFDLSGGFYWTPHLKIELDIARTTTGTVYVEQPPSPGVPFFRSREHSFSTTSVGAGLSYQFFENAWFHPFAGGGVVVIDEHERAGEAQPTVIFRDSLTPIPLPQPPAIDQTTTSMHPFGIAGFKLFVAERAFIRSDVRVVVSGARGEAVVWRTGFGFDF